MSSELPNHQHPTPTLSRDSLLYPQCPYILTWPRPALSSSPPPPPPLLDLIIHHSILRTHHTVRNTLREIELQNDHCNGCGGGGGGADVCGRGGGGGNPVISHNCVFYTFNTINLSKISVTITFKEGVRRFNLP